MAKLYVIKDLDINEVVAITDNKETLKAFLEKRDPSLYEWVKIKNKKHIQMTVNRYNDCILTGYGDFALTQNEFEAVQDRMMELPPCLMYEVEKTMNVLKYLKLSDEELSQIQESLAIIYSRLRSIEEPPGYIDVVLDETYLIDEYLLAKKYFMEECL